VPAIVTAAEEFATAAAQGALQTAIVEYAEGLALVSALSPETVLLVLLRPDAAVGPLLFELRRNRTQMATLV
jgi:predicted regulator of Ras-like GTPase activity (Roadblock/LC7/MglB family)